MTDMIVKLQCRKQYGLYVMYPDNHNAITFARMVKHKTLGPSDVDCIRALGFKIEVVGDLPPETE